MRYAVIMAGGSGKRLWPLSRQARPKQLLPLIGGKCLLELAVERLAGLFDADKILVITNAAYADQVAETLTDLPRENVVGEPEGRDTANAIALAAEMIAAKDPEATMAVFTADHVIRPVEAFAAATQTACDAAEQHPDALLTFGIRPTCRTRAWGISTARTPTRRPWGRCSTSRRSPSTRSPAGTSSQGIFSGTAACLSGRYPPSAATWGGSCRTR